MLQLLTEPSAWLAFATLSALEIVLGIDNVVFITILADKLPAEQRNRARRLGLGMAMFMRIALLFAITWVVKLTTPLFTVIGYDFSGRDLILLFGGLFLLGKSTLEIHSSLEGEEGHASAAVAASFGAVIVQILVLDAVFSLDSIITAVGMVDEVPIMIAAVCFAVGVMMLAANSISAFVIRHPTVKMLALSFLILIGVALVAEGFHHKIPKGYIYFSMCFALGVEMLNLRMKSKSKPMHLRSPIVPEGEEAPEIRAGH